MNTRTAWQPWFAWYPVTVIRDLDPELRGATQVRKIVFLEVVERRLVNDRWQYRAEAITLEEYEADQW